jgi:uncharacterized Zn-binding protein involved in type VI secretion
MPGAILHAGAVVTCAHGGPAVPTAPSASVFVSGLPIVTIAAPYAISACPFVPPIGDGPCVTGRWITGATRVFSHGAPVAITTGASFCSLTGAPLLVVAAQTTVLAR